MDKRIRKWLRGDFYRSLRVDYFPFSPRAHRWNVAGVDRLTGRCVASSVGGPNAQVALDRFARSL